MKFKYKALNSEQEILVDTVDLQSEKDVVKYLRELNLKPVFIKEDLDSGKKVKVLRRHISSKDLQIFLYKLYIMTDTGLTIPHAVNIIASDEKDIQKRKIYSGILNDLNRGYSFTKALEERNYFPDFLIKMLEGAEETADLKNAFYSLYMYYKNREKFEKKIKSALYYPALLIFVCIAVVNFLCLEVLPNFANILNFENLPLSTKILMNISDFLGKNFYVLFISAISVILFLVLFNKTDQGREISSRILLKSRIYKSAVIKNFAEMACLLLENGKTLYHTVIILSQSFNNTEVKKELMKISGRIRDGITLSSAMADSEIFPEFVLSMVKVSEESSKTSEIFKNIKDYYAFDINFRQERFIRILEPAIIIIMASVVGYIVLSVAIPMFDVVNGI